MDDDSMTMVVTAPSQQVAVMHMEIDNKGKPMTAKMKVGRADKAANGHAKTSERHPVAERRC